MEYTQVDVRSDEQASEILQAVLAQAGFDAFLQTPQGFQAAIPSEMLDQSALEGSLEDLRTFLDFELVFQKQARKNWNQDWENSYEPVVVNAQCAIYHPRHDISPDVAFPLFIEPDMAFGTGHHQTTRMVLSALFLMELKGKKLLDVGTGTGVLAILAAQLGADCFGCDIDAFSVKNAQHNAALNQVSLTLSEGDVHQITERNFSVILANLNTNIILNNLPIYNQLLVAGGQLLLSGFLSEDLPKITAFASSQGFGLVSTTEEQTWVMAHLEKNA